MGKASKFGLRKAAEEKTKKHAQRTPLPPRPGQVQEARDAIEMAEAIQSTGKAFAKKIKKEAKRAAREAEQAATMAAKPAGAPRPPQDKSAAFMADAKALGWDVDAALSGSAVLTDVIQASRGDEVIQIEWQNNVFMNNCLYRRPDGSSSKLRNASHARQTMALPAPTQQQLAARKAVREKTSGLTRQPVRQITFDMDAVGDEELAEALKGAKLVWVNSISGAEDADVIPPSAKVYVDVQSTGRCVHFNSPTGARSVRISSIIHVSGQRAPKRQKVAH